MNKKQIEVEKSHLKLEKEALDELTKTYEIALNDIKERAKNLKSEEMLESKIRQLNYQNALENQVSGILDVLKTDNTVTINKYLTKAYENGFIGTLYNMQSEEIPIAFGIDEKKVLTSISKKIDDMTFADRVDTNMDDFKKKIKAEITRGIANNSKYNEIARNLDNVTQEGINSSYRICRTEMGRISQESKFDCMLRAKENGADIVKQWDSTMDGKTREAHSKLDGQVKELDEPFEIEINGHKVEAMYPCGFGIASMDINCRCVVLERARWAIEGELNGENTFTKAVRNNDGMTEIKEFNTSSYNAFKKDFFKWQEEIKEKAIEEIKTLTNEQLNNSFKEKLKQIYERNRKELGLNLVPVDELGSFSPFEVNFGNVDNKIANAWVNQFEELSNDYYTTIQKVIQTKIYDGPIYNPHVINRTELNPYVSSSEIKINNNLTDYDEFMERMKTMVKTKHSVQITEENFEKYVATHEFAHTLSLVTQEKYKTFVGADIESIKKFNNSIKNLFEEYQAELKVLNDERNRLNMKFLMDTDNFTNEDQKKVNEIQDKLNNVFISKYANENEEEFMAEAFTDYKIGLNTSSYSQRVGELIDKYFKRGV